MDEAIKGEDCVRVVPELLHWLEPVREEGWVGKVEAHGGCHGLNVVSEDARND